MKIKIPNFKNFKLEYLILDYNGSLANNGKVNDYTKELIRQIAKLMDIYVVTADTFGSVREELNGLPVKIQITSKDNGSMDKKNHIKSLGSSKCVAVGNGQNDNLMLEEAELSICIVGNEGCFSKNLLVSDIAINSIENALKLFLDTKKLIATLRK